MAVLGQVATEAFPQLTITQSQTWVPPQDGNVCIHVVGAGGGATGQSASPYGGGAGGYGKIPTLAVTTSGSYTLVVGAGGIGGAAQGAWGTIAGTGGSSQISGTGLTGTKTAGGGTGGRNASQSPASANGAGGTISGSGQSWAGNTGGAGSTSGGAVGIYGTGNAGTANIASRGGGMTDAQSGGLAMSGYGIICGGSKSSPVMYFPNAQKGSTYLFTASDLCGGGAVIRSNTGAIIHGTNGGIGGGGGGSWNSTTAGARGGNGGDGIILIQYLPW